MVVLALTSLLAGSLGSMPPSGQCAASTPPEAAAASQAASSIPASDPPEGSAVRISGDAKVTRTDSGHFVFGPMLINTPLPVGYPDPTPPGVIEIKRYPVVRRAEVSGSMSPGIGMNLAFWPLFQHIKSRDIEMTAPVEMNYTGTGKKTPEGGDAKPDTWTMSFLYRRTDQGPTGPDERRRNVQVVDVPAVTVISIGVRGSYDYVRMQREWRTLENWLSQQTVWDAAGEPRALHYNGPERRESDKWSEVQIPIRLISSAPAATPATTPSTATSAAPPAAVPAGDRMPVEPTSTPGAR